MKTVHEVSELTGISIRALQYYDQIGLLSPAERTEAGYRLYDDAALEKLQQILLFRSLEFKLQDIKTILDDPAFDRARALEDQIALLEMRKRHIEGLIRLAQSMKKKGMNPLSFAEFDTKKMDAYAAEAKARWGKTKEYQEFTKKDQGRTPQERDALTRDMMKIFADLGRLKNQDPACEEAQKLIGELRAFITRHFYSCTKPILLSLGGMYASGGEFTENIDRAGGEGTGDFAWRAIQIYCEKA